MVHRFRVKEFAVQDIAAALQGEPTVGRPVPILILLTAVGEDDQEDDVSLSWTREQALELRDQLKRALE